MRKYRYCNPGQLATPEQEAAFVVEFYDSIQELPMFRLNEFNIHLSQDAGIGSTLADFDTRMDALVSALSSGSLDNAIAEHYNARLGLYLMLDGISTKARCLADVVHAINGKPVATFTDDEMMAVHGQLIRWMSQEQATEVVDGLKKKLNRELKLAFPDLFPDAEEMEFYINVVKRAKLQLAHALHEKDVSGPLAEIDAWLSQQMAPANFDFTDTNNAVETKRRDFALIVAGLAMRGVADAGRLSAYQFHATIQVVKSQTPTAAAA